MDILIYFMGTGCTYDKSVKPYSSKFKNVGIKKGQSASDWNYTYYFNGPGIFNTLGWTTEKAYDAATKILPPAIKGMLMSAPDETIHIYVRGHSRGGTVSVKFYQYLAGQFGSNEKIVLTLKNSDSYYGPTAKKENALIRLKNPGNNSTSSNKTIVTYAVQTLFRCTPQQIVGPDIVIIVNTGHNMSGIALWDPPENKGLYLAYLQTEKKEVPNKERSSLQKRFGLNKVVKIYSCKYVLISRAAEPIKEFFDFIYKYGKVTQTNRWRLFTTILIQRLDLKSYDDLEEIVAIPKSILFPNVKKEFNDALNSIRRSINLTIAFNTAIKLFSPGEIFSGMGGEDFHMHLLNA